MPPLRGNKWAVKRGLLKDPTSTLGMFDLRYQLVLCEYCILKQSNRTISQLRMWLLKGVENILELGLQ